MRKFRRNPTKLHSTFKSDTYHAAFSDLPKKAQEILLNTPVEVERSRYTVYESSAFIRNKIEVDGRYFDAEISLGSVDVRHSGYRYNHDQDCYLDEKGICIDADKYAEWAADELTYVVEIENYDVYLTETDEPMPERRIGQKLRRNPVREQINFNNYKDEMTDDDIDQIVSLLCHGCRVPTYTKIRSILTYGKSRLPRHGIFDRIVKEGNKWSYIAGQSYTDEIRYVRELMLK